jgi:hypothetical protein
MKGNDMPKQSPRIFEIFETKVDLRSRADMQYFLDNHHTYQGSFAHNVKLCNLSIPVELSDAANAIIYNPDSPFWMDWYQQDTISDIQRRVASDLKCDTVNIPVTFGLEGRSNGHLVMQYKQRVLSGQTKHAAYDFKTVPYTAPDFTDIRSMTTADLRDMVKDVIFFDRMADAYRADFITCCKLEAEVNSQVSDNIEDSSKPAGSPVKRPKNR